MFYQVNAGATGTNALNAYNRHDTDNNNLTGIRAARSHFIKRHDADATSTQEASSPVGAGIISAKRPDPVQKTEASGGQGIKDMKSRPGLSVALDVLESSEEGRAILAKLKASDTGIDIFYQRETGDRAFVYVGGLEKEYWEARDRITARKIAQDTADTVDISDEGRELAAQMRLYSSTDEAPAELKKFFDNEALEIERKAVKAANPFSYTHSNDAMDHVYADSTLLYALYSNPDMASDTAFKLSAEVGRLLKAPAATLEEGVANRAKGLELAKYIVENYIDDPADKQKVLDRAKELANVFEQRDKGYAVAMTTGGYSVTKVDDGLLIQNGKPTEKTATDIINRAKNSLDMNAVKEDALNILKTIMADFVNSNGNLALPK